MRCKDNARLADHVVVGEVTYVLGNLTGLKSSQKVVFVDGKSDVEIPLTRLNEGDEEKSAIYEEALDYMQFCNATSS